MKSRFARWQAGLDRHAKELLHGASTALMLQIVGTTSLFGYYVLLGRLLGATGAGVYFLALSVVSFAAILAGLGLNNATLRFVGAESAAGNWAGVRGVTRLSVGVVLGTGLLAGVAVFVLAPWLALQVFEKPDVLAPLRWMAFGIAPFALSMLLAHMLKGIKRIGAAITIERIALIVLAAVFFLTVGRRFGAVGATASYAVAAGVTAAVAYALWWRYTPADGAIRPQFGAGQLFASAWPLYLVAVATWVNNWFGVFSLGVWRSADEVAIFSVAWRTAFLISFVLVAINAIAAPKFAASHRVADRSGMEDTGRYAVRLAVVAALPMLAVLLAAPGWIMGLFGPEFAGGGTVLMILALTQFANAAAGPVGVMLMMSGQERLVRNIVLTSTAVLLAMTLWLVPGYGAVGAAVAYCASVVLSNAMFVVGVRRRLGLRLFGRRRVPSGDG